MNKGKTTINRIQWTTLALNFFLRLQHELDALRNRKVGQNANFVKGTQNDADNLTTIITSKLGETPDELDQLQPYDLAFWYHVDPPDDLPDLLPSNSLEEAFTKVHSWHKRHKKVWDVTISVEELHQQIDVDEEFEDSEVSDDENDDNL